MDEIFLQDYANNVAQAQDPFGIAAVQSQPGFENYQPSFANQGLQPMGLIDETPSRLPDFKQMAKNVAENQAKNFLIKKIGLEGLQGNILSSVLGANPYVQGIATIGSALTGNSLNMSNILARKRAEKNYEMNQRRMQNELNKQQTQAIQQRLDSQPVSDQDRNRGQAPSSPTPSAPAARQSRQTSGPGGLHSGY
tara:strand:+ start:1879 stop:2463 length:585 start_codon:yes stop_codon:yes gene_type:complete